MKKGEIKKLYKSLDSMNKEQLLAVLKIRYNEKGLKDIVGYFLLEALDVEDKNEIEEIKYLFKTCKKF